MRPARYRIVAIGRIDPDVAVDLEGAISEDDRTTISIDVHDQAQLAAIVARIVAAGLILVSLDAIGPVEGSGD